MATYVLLKPFHFASLMTVLPSGTVIFEKDGAFEVEDGRPIVDLRKIDKLIEKGFVKKQEDVVQQEIQEKKTKEVIKPQNLTVVREDETEEKSLKVDFSKVNRVPVSDDDDKPTKKSNNNTKQGVSLGKSPTAKLTVRRSDGQIKEVSVDTERKTSDNKSLGI